MNSNALKNLIAAAALATLASACGRADELVTLDAPTVSFSSGKRVVTRVGLRDRVIVHFEGIAPGAPVTLRTEMADGSTSQATFIADAAGRVDTSIAAPVRGDYQGVDADGLFWSMRAAVPSLLTEGPLDVTVIASVEGVELTRAKLERLESATGMVSSLTEDESNPCGTPFPRPPMVNGGAESAE